MLFALREMQILERWRREFSVLLAVGLFLGLLGPYGTYGCLATQDRVAYWMLRSVLVGLICLIAFQVVTATKPFATWSSTTRALAGLFAASIPCAVIGFGLAAFFRHAPDTPLEILGLYGRVALVTATVGIPLHLARTAFPRGRLAPPPAVQTPGGASPTAELAFLRRIPAKLGMELLYIEVEDHYLRVHTRLGNDLVLFRLADAVAELDPSVGCRVHRSYWVARRAVVSVERDRHRIRLVLTNGARIPVSRTYLQKLRSAGWL